MNRREATLSTNLILVQNLFCGRIDFRSKFILRFDFLNITVRHEIGKRYNEVIYRIIEFSNDLIQNFD